MNPFATKTPLYDHQKTAADKLKRLRVGALFMEMRTGKTRTAIELIHQRQAKISRVIWFCPVSAKMDLYNQILYHTNSKNIYVFNDKTTEKTIPSDVDWYIVGLESISGSDKIRLCSAGIMDSSACIILDESDLCKSVWAKRTRWLNQISECSKYRFILTGTPFLEGPEDLYAQMRFLDWRILGYKSFYTFANNHLEYWENDGLRGGQPAVRRILDREGLARKIAPYTYQVTLGDVSLEPDKSYKTKYFDLTSEQIRAYQEAKNRFCEILDEDLSIYDIYRLFGELRAICCGFSPGISDMDDPKYNFEHDRLSPLIEAIKEIPHDKSIVIWATYQHSINQIREKLMTRFGEEPVEFHGKLKPKIRDENLMRWRQGAKFLLATPYTGGRGISFAEAEYAIFYANDWKTRIRVQAESRIITMDASRKTKFIDVVASDSIDSRILNALLRKESAAKTFHAEIARLRGKSQKLNLIQRL